MLKTKALTTTRLIKQIKNQMTKLVKAILEAPIDKVHDLILNASDEDIINAFKENNLLFFRAVFNAVSGDSIKRIADLSDPQDFLIALLSLPAETVDAILYFLEEKQLSRILIQCSDKNIRDFLEIVKIYDSKNKIIASLPLNRRDAWLNLSNEKENHRKSKETENASPNNNIPPIDYDSENSSASIEFNRLRAQKEEAISSKAEEEIRLSIQQRYSQIQDDISSREKELKKWEKELSEREEELLEDLKLSIQKNIEDKVPKFVQTALELLENRETAYKKKANHWSLLGTAILIICITAVTGISLYGYAYGEALSSLGWETLLFVSFKGLVVISILGLWAKHAYSVSNAYMHEAIKRADRAHAINFGKLYLEIYGNTVDKKELIDIFENWNITSESAFSKYSPDSFEPKILEKFIDFAKISNKKA